MSVQQNLVNNTKVKTDKNIYKNIYRGTYSNGVQPVLLLPRLRHILINDVLVIWKD